MKRLKIVSDGTPHGTRVYDADGKLITAPITRICWEITAPHGAVVQVEFLAEIEVIGEVQSG
ncbi:hypothetical protein [Aquitalea aquatilis]|uniref:hypothetical protein n=1 Tax=Aquitalea aquatilis TaxID=1537400 RepID=UPI0010BDED7B|nr:hypothetical protein [Aquitalea aquatilis]